MLEGRKDKLVEMKVIDKFGVETILDNICDHIARTKTDRLYIHDMYFTHKEQQYFQGKDAAKPVFKDADEMQAAMKKCACTAGVLWMKLMDADSQLNVKRLKRKLLKHLQPEQQEDFNKWIQKKYSDYRSDVGFS